MLKRVTSVREICMHLAISNVIDHIIKRIMVETGKCNKDGNNNNNNNNSDNNCDKTIADNFPNIVSYILFLALFLFRWTGSDIG